MIDKSDSVSFFEKIIEENLKDLSASMDLTPIQKLSYMILGAGCYALSSGHIDAFIFSIKACASMLRDYDESEFAMADELVKDIHDERLKQISHALLLLKAIGKVLTKRDINVEVLITEDDIKNLMRQVEIV